MTADGSLSNVFGSQVASPSRSALPQVPVPELNVVGRDPVGMLVVRIFGRHSGILGLTVAIGGAICVYAIPFVDGTLLPRSAPYPTYYSSLYDINSALIWIIFVPLAAKAYLDQFFELPKLFTSLFQNGVTGLSAPEYAGFIENAQNRFNFWLWPVVSLLAFLPFWIPFCIAVTHSPEFWYYPPTRWPWVLYAGIQYLEISAALAALIRYVITCRQLRYLLKGELARISQVIQPQFLHPDGLGGLGSVVELVQQSLVIAGGILIVATLETVNSSRTVERFSAGGALSGFIVVALAFATIVPYLLLYPLRLALGSLRKAKRHLKATLSEHENEIIWTHVREIPASPPQERDAHVEVLIKSLTPLGQISQALDTVPESLLDLGRQSAIFILLASVTPPILSISYRLASDVFGWNLGTLIRSIIGIPR